MAAPARNRTSSRGVPLWLEPPQTNLLFNSHAQAQLAPYEPARTTLHFTFGSAVMMDFVKNWLHFAKKSGLTPYLIGAADTGTRDYCASAGVASAAIDPRLDVWTYQRKKQSEVTDDALGKTQWQYFRHHNSDFLGMGLVKVAFLWELLSSGLDVLISDLDVVWLNDGWKRWMTWREPSQPPVPEAGLMAMADLLVTTDELNTERDAQGGRAAELNTGVVYLRAGAGARAMVQMWRESMLRLSKHRAKSQLTENDNDQSLFNQIVHGGDVTDSFASGLAAYLQAAGLPELPPAQHKEIAARTRRIFRTRAKARPCLPTESCDAVPFTFATLPIRPFSSGHTWFNQGVQEMEGHELPQHMPVNVHFTFQFGDTPKYPHGKRQRAREAGLWAVDPPEYFTQGVYVALRGPAYSAAEQASVYRRFPEWSPQRHMFMDAPQRQAVRDLLGLASTFDEPARRGVTVLPKFYCHCDRYWNFLTRCRIPFVPKMKLPFGCPMDSLYLTDRWNDKGVLYREHTFLANPNVPRALRENKVLLSVADAGAARTSGPDNATHVEVAYGTPMNDVKAAVLAANPAVRVVEVSAEHLRRLCRWLGSTQKQKAFNSLMRYVLTESSRYCPNEDHGGYGAPGFNWQNPFTAYNCTWGFRAPAEYPEQRACGADDPATIATRGSPGSAAAGPTLEERSNSTTCPRQMLCDHNVDPNGRVTREITRCNIEGYNGLSPAFKPIADAMLAKMPGGRCPYPPLDVPGPGPGFDRVGHWVGPT